MAQIFNNHRAWIRGWRYDGDAPTDEQWQKDRSELFALSGNGWWWGWNHVSCPIKGMRPYLKSLYTHRKKTMKIEIMNREN